MGEQNRHTWPPDRKKCWQEGIEFWQDGMVGPPLKMTQLRLCPARQGVRFWFRPTRYDVILILICLVNNTEKMYQKFATLSDTWTFLWTAWHIINNYKIYQTVNRLRSLLSLHVIMSSCRQTGTSQRRCHQARHWLFSICDLWSMITQFFNLWSMYCGDSLKFSLYNLTLTFDNSRFTIYLWHLTYANEADWHVWFKG